jgi:DNA-binding transcriptional LysR family regulator
MLHDLDLLRTFDAVATQLGFGKAARVVGRSPAAVSEQIKRLEEQLEVQLFVRTTRQVSLTDAGRRLLPEARKLIEQARACEEAVRGQGTTPFELRLGTRYELGLSWLLPTLDALEVTRPHRTVHLVFGDSPDLLKKTKAGQVDATVTSERLTDGAFSYALLHEEEYVFVAAPHLLRERPIRHAADVGAHRLIDAHEDLPLFRYFLDTCPREEAWRFDRLEYMSAIGAIRARVLTGAGVAVLPRYWVAGDLGAGLLAEVMPKRSCQSDFFRLVWRRHHPMEHELMALAEQLRSNPLS